VSDRSPLQKEGDLFRLISDVDNNRIHRKLWLETIGYGALWARNVFNSVGFYIYDCLLSNRTPILRTLFTVRTITGVSAPLSWIANSNNAKPSIFALTSGDEYFAVPRSVVITTAKRNRPVRRSRSCPLPPLNSQHSNVYPVQRPPGAASTSGIALPAAMAIAAQLRGTAGGTVRAGPHSPSMYICHNNIARPLNIELRIVLHLTAYTASPPSPPQYLPQQESNTVRCTIHRHPRPFCLNRFPNNKKQPSGLATTGISAHLAGSVKFIIFDSPPYPVNICQNKKAWPSSLRSAPRRQLCPL